MKGRGQKRWAGGILLFGSLTSLACAHGSTSHAVRPELWSLWSFEPGVVLPLLVSAACYVRGLSRLPCRYRREATWFFSGWLLLAVALVSPIHRGTTCRCR